MIRYIAVALAVLALVAVDSRAQEGRRVLEFAPAPVDNPLKGLVPYSGVWKDRFPHSMEFDYLPLAKLVTGPETYDWKPLETLLDACAARGHQVVFRIYLEYPGKADGIPTFLLKDGLKVFKYRDTTTKPPEDCVTPDYADAKLRKVLSKFIAAFGKKYDNDPRIGFITAGLLGHWGEWHNYPKEELFADRALQNEVMDAYEAAFKVTPVLLRYPTGKTHESLAPNAGRKFGYHDDSFAWGTLDTGREDDSWFYMTQLKAAGAVDKWKTQPIGGEIRPESWGKVFDAKPGVAEIQDFRKCVQETHASWLMDSGMFEKTATAARRKRAEEEVHRMGYEFHVGAVTIGKIADGKLPVTVELENRGLAPFYVDWPGEYALLMDGKTIKTFKGSGKLTGLLPGDKVRLWNDTLDLTGVAAGQYQLAVRVPNPMPKGHPVRFANKSQYADAPGWLTLGAVQLR